MRAQASFVPPILELSLLRGDRLDCPLWFQDSDGAPIDFSARTMKMEIKNQISHTQAPLFTLTSTAGLRADNQKQTPSGPLLPCLVVNFTPACIAALEGNVVVYGDIQETLGSQLPYTYLRISFKFEEDTTL